MREIVDRTVIETASWRLASELFRRHPRRLRLIRVFPGGGQYDVLWLMDKATGSGGIRLNRHGTIQVGRFDGTPSPWRPCSWDACVAADPREFLLRLERAAGLPPPTKVPATTPESLTYRVLAAIVASATKGVHPVDVSLGYIDSSGMLDSGENPDMELFRPDRALLVPLPNDLLGTPGYRFWIVSYDHEPLMVVEQSTAVAWNRKHRRLSLAEEYSQAQRRLDPVAARALAFAFGRL